MTIDDAITVVQFAYPQVYYACHTRHERRRSSALRLSRRDSELLVHLDRADVTLVTELARHLDLAASTVSEAVSRLEKLGFIRKADRSGDRRRVGLLLTDRGADAVRGTSVLERARLRTVLSRLSVRDRAVVTRGLRLLARACRPAAARPDRPTP